MDGDVPMLSNAFFVEVSKEGLVLLRFHYIEEDDEGFMKISLATILLRKEDFEALKKLKLNGKKKIHMEKDKINYIG